MREKLISSLGLLATTAVVLIYLSFGIGASDSMPSYAVLFVDDISKTYLAPQCVEQWKRKPTNTVDVMRRTTAEEAYRLRYIPRL